MWHNVYLFKNTPRVIIASSVVFALLNFIENVIHFSIGVHHSPPDVVHNQHIIIVPQGMDLIKMICTMLIFALLQGICTALFLRYM